MTYRLEFLPSALKEWEKLGHTVHGQLKKKLRERLELPQVQADALRDMPGTTRSSCVPRAIGWCTGLEDERVVVVVAVGKRERGVAHERVRER